MGQTKYGCSVTIAPEWYVLCHWLEYYQTHSTEEEDEIQVIQQALIDHLEISPAITLGVLYDQLLPADDTVDESERDIRVKLASIVHSFLTNAARTAIDGRPTRNADYADAFIAVS